MRYKIIADSCCDLTRELREEMQVTTIPLNMTLGDKCFVDDDTLDLPQFMEEMKACTTKIDPHHRHLCCIRKPFKVRILLLPLHYPATCPVLIPVHW